MAQQVQCISQKKAGHHTDRGQAGKRDEKHRIEYLTGTEVEQETTL